MLLRLSKRQERKQTQARIERLRKLQKEAWRDMKHCYACNDANGYQSSLGLYTMATKRILIIKGKR